MSEYITHIAIQEDSARLALHAPNICDAFKYCFKHHGLAARLGSSSRGNSTFIVQNIHYYRDIWASRQAEDRLEDKLAYTLGWITHRAADRFFKPRYGIFDKNPDNRHPVEIRILHDVEAYDKVYDNGALAPFTRGFDERDMASHPAAKLLDVAKAEDLFGPKYQADFLSLQSFEVESGEAFMKRVNKQFAEFTVDFNRFADAIHRPNIAERVQMIEAPNFYDENDALIQLARTLQAGNALGEEMRLEEALKTENASQYAQALSKSFLWIQAASDHFSRRSNTSQEDLFQTFNIADSQKKKRY